MERVAIDFGPIQIYWYSIIVFVGLLVGSIIIFKEARKRKISEEFLINLICDSIIIGIIGARLYYVLFNLSYYLHNPLEIFAFWNGGLAIHGGVFAALIFIIIYCKKNKINILQTLDVVVVGLIIGQAIGRWGNFFNAEAYGQITTLSTLQSQGIPKFIIDGMYILGEYRQPTFLYESVWCLAGFIALLIIRKCKYLKRGQLTGFYLIWYGLARFVIEAMRSDSLMLGNLKIAQVVSVIFVLAGMILAVYNVIKSTNEDQKLYTEDLTPIDENAGFITYYKKRGDRYV